MIRQLGDIDTAVLIESELNRIEDVGLRRKQFNAETVHYLKRFEGFVRLAIESPQFAKALLPGLMDLHQRFTGDLCETLSQIAPGYWRLGDALRTQAGV